MPDVVRDSIAREVRAEMARQGKTQRDLGEALDLPQSSISLRLQGERPFRAEELVLVAGFLGVPITNFTAPAAAAA